MECSITQMSNNRARLISRDKNSRPGVEKALIGIRGHRHCLWQSHLETQQAAAGTLFKEKKSDLLA